MSIKLKVRVVPDYAFAYNEQSHSTIFAEQWKAQQDKYEECTNPDVIQAIHLAIEDYVYERVKDGSTPY